MNVGPRGNPLSIQWSVCARVRQPYVARPCHPICGRISLAHSAICALSILSLHRLCHPHSVRTLPFFFSSACMHTLLQLRRMYVVCMHTCHLFLISFSFNLSFAPFLSQLKQQNTVSHAQSVSVGHTYTPHTRSISPATSNRWLSFSLQRRSHRRRPILLGIFFFPTFQSCNSTLGCS